MKGDTSFMGQRGDFPSTSWSTIRRAQDKDSPDCKKSLENLIATYWKPVYVYFRRTPGMTVQQAEDYAQDFFIRLIEKDIIQVVDESRGSFRSFLLTALRNYMINKKRDEKTQKRGGGLKFLSLDFESAEGLIPSDAATPEEAFQKAWLMEIFQVCCRKLEEALAAEEKQLYFEVFKAYDIEGATDKGVSYESIAAELKLKPNDVRHYLRYARKLFRKIVTDYVADYTGSPEELAQEMKLLFR